MKKAFLFASLALVAAVIFTGCKKDDGDKTQPGRDRSTYGVPAGTLANQVLMVMDATTGEDLIREIGSVTVSVAGDKKLLAISAGDYTINLEVTDNDMVFDGSMDVGGEGADFNEAVFMTVSGAQQTIKSGVTASFGGYPWVGGQEACLTYNNVKYNGAYLYLPPRPARSYMIFVAGTVTGLEGSQSAKSVALVLMSNNMI